MEAAGATEFGGGPPTTDTPGSGAAPPGATPLRAAAGVLVLIALGAIQVRMDEPWGTGIFLVLYLLGTLLVLGLGLLAAGVPLPAIGDRPARAATISKTSVPDGAVTALLVSGVLLALSTIGNLAEVLGSDGGPGSTTWTSLLFAATAAYPAWILRSPVCALLSSGALGVTFLALIDWIFDPSSLTTFRWLFVILIVAYVGVAVFMRPIMERHAIQHVNAAGIVVVVLAATLFFEPIAEAFSNLFGGASVDSFNGPLGWELISIVASAALVGFAIVTREVGAGLLGSSGLAIAVAAAAVADEKASLVGWPLLLALLAVAAVAAVFATEDVP